MEGCASSSSSSSRVAAAVVTAWGSTLLEANCKHNTAQKQSCPCICSLKDKQSLISPHAAAQHMVNHSLGVVCRLEKDAVDWARILGGLPKYLGEYAKAFGAAGFSKKKDLYIASGLLSYNASAEMQQMLQFLQPYARSAQYKELYLSPEVLPGLNPEQEALVDFLVLSNSDNFVGLGSSTFSVYLRYVLGETRIDDWIT